MAIKDRYCNNIRCKEYGIPFIFQKTRENKHTWSQCPGCGHETIPIRDGEDIPTAEYIDGGSGKLVVLNSSRQLPASTTASNAKAGEGAPLLFGESSAADVKVKCGDIKGCPLVGKNAGKRIFISTDLYHTWQYAALHFSTEWLAMLTGEEKEDGWYIDGQYIPLQRVTGGNVWAETIQEQPRTIGSVHSHVKMDAFFSTTDEEHFNHPVELVINARGEMDAVTRIQLRCGEYQRVTSPITTIPSEPLRTVLTELKEKMIIVTCNEPRTNHTDSSHYAHFNYNGQLIKKSGEMCMHNVPVEDRCDECNEWASHIKEMKRGPSAIQRTDLPPQSSTTTTSNYLSARLKDPEYNPSDALYNKALEVVAARIAYEESHGTKEQLDSHSTN